MVTLTINGREHQAEEGTTILELARSRGIPIPALCNHEAVKPYGACRLCMVEIAKDGRSRLVTSCLYQVEEGLEVQTHSEKVINVRRGIVELLLSRCPNVRVVRDLATELHIKEPLFPTENEDEDCILCGLCARVCTEVVGVSAISLVNRGTGKEAASPFHDVANDCIGCLSCAFVCPTGAIKAEDREGYREIPKWGVRLKLKQCETCGYLFAPEKQLQYISKHECIPEDSLNRCQDCRSKAGG